MLPPELFYLWNWFSEHSMGLAQNGMAPPVVTWESLRAWCEQMRVELEPWEARAMVLLGGQRAAIINERQSAKINAKAKS